MGVVRQSYNKANRKNNRKETRRGNNEGGISERADGRYQGEVTVKVDALSGKRKKKYVYGKSYEECLAKVQDLTHDVRHQEFFEPSKVLLKDWLYLWLNTYMKNSIARTTFWSYETNIRVHIIPALGNIKLSEVNLAKCQLFINQLFSEGLSNPTVQKNKNILNGSLKKAVLQGLLKSNPISEGLVFKKNEKSGEIKDKNFDDPDHPDNVKIFTIIEQKLFQALIVGRQYYALFMTALHSGLRIGELAALKWKNVNLKSGYINVRATAVRVPTEGDTKKNKTEIILTTPKSNASIRTVPIPKPLVEILRIHQQKQDETFRQWNARGAMFNELGLVFPSKNGTILDNRNIMRSFYSVLEKNNLPDYNFHCTRHSYASRLLENNVNLKHISELLGHEDIAFTAKTYTHVLNDQLKISVNSLDTLF